MSSVAPEIRELEPVPEAARPLVYMHAMMHAVRTPLTLLLAIVAFAIAVGVGIAVGERAAATPGAILGGAIGAVTAACLFYKVLLPWRARRALPAVLREMDWSVIERIGHAADNIARGVNAYKQRDAMTNARLRGPDSHDTG